MLPRKSLVGAVNSIRDRISRVGGAVRAQSQTIGTILLVAVALVLIAATAAFVLSDGSPSDEDKPELVRIDSELTKGAVEITHEGGDAIDPENVEVRLETRSSAETFSLASEFSNPPPPDQRDRFTAGNQWENDLSSVPLSGSVDLLVVHTPTNSVLHEESYDLPREFQIAINSVSIGGIGGNVFTTDTDQITLTVGYSATNLIADEVNEEFELLANGAVKATQSLTVGASETVSNSFSSTFDADLASGLDIEIRGGNAVGTRSFGPSNYAVSIDTAADDINVGQQNDISYSVENTGELSDEQNITLRINDADQQEKTDVEIDPGESSSGVFEDVQVNAGDTIEVVSEDDTATLSFDAAVFEVQIDSSPSEFEDATEGDSITLDYTVENTGSIEGTKDIELLVADETIATASDVTIDASTSEQRQFDVQVPATGRLNVTVATVDDNATTRFTADGLLYGGDSVAIHEAGGLTPSDDSTISGSVSSIAVSPDDRQVALGGTVYTTGDWTVNKSLASGVESVAWSSDGSQLALATGSDVKVYNTGDWSQATTLTDAGDTVQSLAWSGGGKLAAGSADETVYVYDTGLSLDEQLTDPSAAVTSVAWGGDLAVGTAGDGVYVYDDSDFSAIDPASASPVETAQAGGSFPVEPPVEYNITDGPTAVINEEITVDNIDIDTSNKKIVLESAITFQSDQKTSVGVDSVTGTWTNLTANGTEMDVGTELTVDPADKQSVSIKGSDVESFAFASVDLASSDTELNYSSNSQVTVTVTELQANTDVEAVDASGTVLASGTTDDSGTVTLTLPDESGDTDVSLTAKDDPTIPDPGDPGDPGDTSQSEAVAWSPDDSQLAVATGDSVKIYDTADYSVDRTLDRASSTVEAVAWNDDGTELAYAAGGSVYVDNPADGSAVAELTETSNVDSIEYLPASN
jgi:hypothetical protein